MAARKVAIVTGASSGVGRSTAVMLGAAGYDVVLVGRDVKRLEEAAAMVRDERRDAATLTLSVDLSDAQATRAIVDRTLETFGRVDAIANVAGRAQSCPIERITDQEWRLTIDTNVSCVMHLTSAAWPAFRKQNAGVIVNVSSLASIDPFPGFAMYAPAKAALNMFTLVTAREGAAIGVKAVTIAPGAIETPMLRSLFSEKTLPTENTLDPDEVAAVIVDCVTGKRAFAVGEVIQLPSPS